jgi:hypothetical protein
MMTLIAGEQRTRRAWLAVAILLVIPSATGKARHDSATTQVEIQIALCSEPEKIVHALDLAPRGRSGETWLFDDDVLTLFEHGLRFRLRAIAGGGELTLKAAVRDCAGDARGLVPAKAGKCEYDMHGETMTAAVSLTSRLDASEVTSLLSGKRPLAAALSAAQVRFLTESTKLWPPPPGLRPLGPIEVLSYRGRDLPYDVDISRLPSGDRYVEVSRKVALGDVAAARKTLGSDLARTGITACADQSAQAVNKLRGLLRGH